MGLQNRAVGRGQMFGGKNLQRHHAGKRAFPQQVQRRIQLVHGHVGKGDMIPRRVPAQPHPVQMADPDAREPVRQDGWRIGTAQTAGGALPGPAGGPAALAKIFPQMPDIRATRPAGGRAGVRAVQPRIKKTGAIALKVFQRDRKSVV